MKFYNEVPIRNTEDHKRKDLLKGKPSERMGRKASGLSPRETDRTTSMVHPCAMCLDPFKVIFHLQNMPNISKKIHRILCINKQRIYKNSKLKTEYHTLQDKKTF